MHITWLLTWTKRPADYEGTLLPKVLETLTEACTLPCALVSNATFSSARVKHFAKPKKKEEPAPEE